MTFSQKNRPPSRLFSWISQWARRSSNDECSPSHVVTPPPPTPPANETTSDDAMDDDYPTQPINVPRPSITLSVAGTMDETLYSTSDSSSSSYPRHRRPSSTVSFRMDELPTRLGTSFPESNKRLSITPSRPASVFSLPTPNTRMSRDEPRPRLSCDVEFQAPPPPPPPPPPPAPPPPPPPSPPPSSDWPRADRMIVSQELIKLALDGLFCSPLDLADTAEERKILHIGCGDGAWSRDMATKYKHCWVLGVDERDALDPNKPMPRNFRFLKSNRGILHSLRKLPDNQFDFIYGRFLIFSYSPDYYREIIQECWRLCRPSGYVEMMELDMRIYGNPVVGPMTQMLNAQVIYLMECRSLDPHFARYLQDLFFFHELVEQMHQRHGDAYHAKYTSLPIGVWGGRIGVMFRDDLNDLIETIHAREQQDYDPWTDRRLKAMLERVDEEFETHWAFMNLHHAYAQKL